MKITLTGDDAIRLEPTSGPLTIEAPTADMGYSPFHMLASALATCTFSVLQSWATHKKLSVDDLILDVQWKFADDPHRVSDLDVSFTWPSLPGLPDREGAGATPGEPVATAPSAAAPKPPAAPSAPPAPAAASVPPAPTSAPNAPASPNMHGDPAAAPEVPAGAPVAT